MKPYQSDLKINGELEPSVAQQELNDLPASVAFMIVVQLLVAAFLIVAVTFLPAHDVAAKEPALGDHPAVIVFKKWNQAEYVNRTAIYPHPAAISWYMQDPNAPDHPLPGAHPKKMLIKLQPQINVAKPGHSRLGVSTVRS